MLTPTIAAVNGACVTGALELMLCCTMAVASDRAIFADTHTKVGLLPGWGMSAHLPAAVGAARAAQLSLTGLPVDASTALAWGLVNEVLPHESLLPRAYELATAVAALSHMDVEAAMRLARDGRNSQLDQLRQLEKRRRSTLGAADSRAERSKR
jgi:enoyl-CoA hydratase